MNQEKCIYVYADWFPTDPVLVGRLYVAVNRNKETFSFEYSKEWLKHNAESKYPVILLDPDLPLFRGRQYLSPDKPIFGLFSDACPDRWHRLRRLRIFGHCRIHHQPQSIPCHGSEGIVETNCLWDVCLQYRRPPSKSWLSLAFIIRA